MAMLLCGKIILVLFIVTVMGLPLVYYIKRDRKWLASDRSVSSWYNVE